MKTNRWKWMSGALAVALLGITVAPAAPASDYAALKRNIEVFEGILNTILAQNFPDPFTILEKPRGVYLDGYGALFSFEIDISTVKQATLFSPARATAEEEKKAFAERLPKLKGVLQKTLADHGDSLAALSSGEQVAIAGHLFNSGVLSAPLTLKTVLVRTPKKNILDFKAGRVTYEELKKRMEIVQY